MNWTTGQDQKIISKLDEYIFKSNKEIADILIKSGEFGSKSYTALKKRVTELRKMLGK